jgi:hypothetical protein
MHVPTQGLRCARSAPRVVTLLEDAARREANRVYSKQLRGKDEYGEEGEVTPPPHSPLPEDLPLRGAIFSQQAGIFVGARRSKQPRTEIESSTSPPLQPRLALVTLDLQGVSVVLVVTGMSLLLGVLKALPSSSATGVATVIMVRLSSSDAEDAEHLTKKARPLSSLPVSSRYGVVCRFTPLSLFLFLL